MRQKYVNALNIAQLKAENEIRQQAIRECAEVAENVYSNNESEDAMQTKIADAIRKL